MQRQSNKVMNTNNKTSGYRCKEYGMPVKRYCQTMDLKNDPELIAKYKEAHDRYHSWPEIREGIKSVGILEMEIYILDNHLFMIVETPVDFDWDSAMTKLATLPRQAEWDEKWQMMERMFYLYE